MPACYSQILLGGPSCVCQFKTAMLMAAPGFTIFSYPG